MRSWVQRRMLQDSNGNVLSYVNKSIRLAVVPPMAKLKLQCEADNLVCMGSMGTTGDFMDNELPTTALAPTDIKSPTFWLALNEWLFVSAEKEVPTWSREVSAFFSDQAHLLTDVSDSLEVIELSGKQSTSLLAQGCGIDFYRDEFLVGQYASTRLFQLPALIQRVGETPVFHIYVDRSEALHLWRILARQATVSVGIDKEKLLA